MKKLIEWLSGGILKDLGTILDDVITSKEEKEQAKAALKSMILDHALNTDELRAKIISDEAKGNFIQRSWRPILMLSFGLIIVFSWFVYPLIKAFNPDLPELKDIPNDLWNVLQIGIGGYIVGRTVEKVAPQININRK